MSFVRFCVIDPQLKVRLMKSQHTIKIEIRRQRRTLTPPEQKILELGDVEKRSSDLILISKNTNLNCWLESSTRDEGARTLCKILVGTRTNGSDYRKHCVTSNRPPKPVDFSPYPIEK